MKRVVLAVGTVLVLLAGVLVLAASLADDDRGMRVMPGSGAMVPGTGSTHAHHHGPGFVVTDESAYLSEMIAHHQDAVTAATELARSERPQMRALGTAIVTSQTAQIEQMRGWVEEWYPDAETPRYQPMMSDLTELRGDELDETFLAEMLQHHMTAVMMSQQLLVSGLDVHPEVAALARDIRDAQRVEIHRMARWYAAWFGGDPGLMPAMPH